MAKQHGVPGEWARVRGMALSLWPFFIALFCAGALATATVLSAYTVWFMLAFAVSLAFTGIYWRKGLRRVERFFHGAHGEEYSAARLMTLPDNWHIFHDFVAGRERVDHVLVSTAGVFAVETKTWESDVTVEEGHVLINGLLPGRDPVSQTRRQMKAVEKLVSGYDWPYGVTGVLCFASGTLQGGPVAVNGITVTNLSDFIAAVRARANVTGQDTVDRLVQRMRARR